MEKQVRLIQYIHLKLITPKVFEVVVFLIFFRNRGLTRGKLLMTGLGHAGIENHKLNTDFQLWVVFLRLNSITLLKSLSFKKCKNVRFSSFMPLNIKIVITCYH